MLLSQLTNEPLKYEKETRDDDLQTTTDEPVKWIKEWKESNDVSNVTKDVFEANLDLSQHDFGRRSTAASNLPRYIEVNP
jgi:hypothetical protein